MATLTITPEGSLNIPKELVQGLGMKPGEKMQLELLSNCSAILTPARADETFKPKGRLEDLFGCLAGKTDVKLTIEEMNEAIAKAGAEAGMAGLR
jgi:antitoxin component of MazEF toxin-antitoxin module